MDAGVAFHQLVFPTDEGEAFTALHYALRYIRLHARAASQLRRWLKAVPRTASVKKEVRKLISAKLEDADTLRVYFTEIRRAFPGMLRTRSQL